MSVTDITALGSEPLWSSVELASVVGSEEQGGEAGPKLYFVPADGAQHPWVLGYLLPVGFCPL